MPRSQFIDFKAVKAAITMEGVLEHYGLMNRFKRTGESLGGPCPIHKGENPTQFRVSVSKNIWNCFSKCDRGGNVLDFISLMEGVSIHAAAVKAIEWFGLDSEAMKADSENEKREKSEAQPKKEETPKVPETKATPKEDTNGANKPLKFRLDKLERNHPYLAERGLTPETIIDFGIGYCAKGMMAERIAIPIHNVRGEVLAYAGRFPGESPDKDTEKYKLPKGFKKTLEVFNLDRAIKERANVPLVIVEGFFGCMKLHQHGCRKVAALMGSYMSPAQEELIRKHTNSQSQIIVMLDEDEAGQEARGEIAARLATFAFVKVHVFDKPGAQAEDLSAEEVQGLLGGAA